jgi:hypothetical protein
MPVEIYSVATYEYVNINIISWGIYMKYDRISGLTQRFFYRFYVIYPLLCTLEFVFLYMSKALA